MSVCFSKKMQVSFVVGNDFVVRNPFITARDLSGVWGTYRQWWEDHGRYRAPWKALASSHSLPSRVTLTDVTAEGVRIRTREFASFLDALARMERQQLLSMIARKKKAVGGIRLCGYLTLTESVQEKAEVKYGGSSSSSKDKERGDDDDQEETEAADKADAAVNLFAAAQPASTGAVSAEEVERFKAEYRRKFGGDAKYQLALSDYVRASVFLVLSCLELFLSVGHYAVDSAILYAVSVSCECDK
jgi:hypothetical protein